MGSGLILLVIVGAWLVVLVPMALRKHDASNLATADRFHDAMRVLSRRDRGTGDRAPDRVEVDAERPGRVRSATDAARARLTEREARPRASAAARRRRALTCLILLSVGTAVGAVVGPLWLLAPHLVVDLLITAFAVHLRRTAVARAERDWRPSTAAPPAPSRRVEARPALRAPVHVAGIPDRMPARPLPMPLMPPPMPMPMPMPLPLGAPAAVPAARHDEVPAARGAVGEAWSPVPVPPPTYLSAPAAPRRVVDLTRPGAYTKGQTDGLADAERELGIVDQGPQLEEILDRRRAVNDW